MSRKYVIVSDYFSKIRTEEQAYFLGLFFADGCNVTGTNEVRIELQSADRAILECFQKALQPGRPLLTSRRGDKEYTLLTACHRQVSSDLAKHGAIPRKSATLVFPSHLPQRLLPHFIRGHFDGDGCLYWRHQLDKQTGNAYLEGRVSIVGPATFCKPLIEYTEGVLGFRPRFYARYQSGIGELIITGNRRVRQFLQWLYADATIFLPRKYTKWKEYLETPTTLRL